MQPWYKQFWPWFLIGLPASAVVASFYTLYLASSGHNDLVVGDYYKEGKAINLQLTELNAALKRHIQAELVRQEDGLDFVLSGDNLPVALPLQVSFHHATLASKDFTVMLTADGSGRRYHLSTSKPLSGRWHVRAEPYDSRWRIQATVNFDSHAPTVLVGRP